MRVNLIRFLNPKEDWRYYRGSAIFGAAVALGAWYALRPRDDVILPAFLVGGAAGSMLLDFAINRAKDLCRRKAASVGLRRNCASVRARPAHGHKTADER